MESLHCAETPTGFHVEERAGAGGLHRDEEVADEDAQGEKVHVPARTEGAAIRVAQMADTVMRFGCTSAHCWSALSI